MFTKGLNNCINNKPPENHQVIQTRQLWENIIGLVYSFKQSLILKDRVTFSVLVVLDSLITSSNWF